MKVYFAHPITDYGTRRERIAVDAVLSGLADATIENPNTQEHQDGYAKGGMEYFKGVVEACHALVFMRFPCGAVGAGVGKEIQWALDAGLEIFEVFGAALYRSTGVPTPVLSIDETRAVICGLRASTQVEASETRLHSSDATAA